MNLDLDERARIDRRLRGYAGKRAALDAAESFDLARASELRLHTGFGFSTFMEYMERRLGYMPHTARERLRVARAVAAMPMIANALSHGAITYSHVRELSRVATPETEDAWLAAIEDKTSGEVQELVAGHEYGDLPTDPVRPDLRPRTVQLELRPEAYAAWREVRKAVADELGRDVSDADVIETLARNYLVPGTGAARPAYQLAYKQCPDCKRASMNGAGREVDVEPEVIERVHCDARCIGDLDAARPERATSSVTPRMREQVFARDRHRCCVPGCRSARNLDVHHIIPQAKGGPHELWNLMLLCDLCRARHKPHYAAYVIMPRRRAGPDEDRVLYAA
jgi:HNH endonuclease